MMHFPLFRISPLFSKNSQTLWKIFKLLPFSEKFLDFHPPKFLMTFFLVIDHKFRLLFTYFTCFSFPTFPPTLTMMHLCITQYTYWTPLHSTFASIRITKK